MESSGESSYRELELIGLLRIGKGKEKDKGKVKESRVQEKQQNSKKTGNVAEYRLTWS